MYENGVQIEYSSTLENKSFNSVRRLTWATDQYRF